jgi:replicative DNA helicase
MAAGPVLERPMPQSLEAERSVLGAVLLDNHALDPAIERLRPEDFFLDNHRRIFQEMIVLGEAQHAIDLVTLTDRLHRSGELEAAGGAAYLAQLVDGVPQVSNIEHYVRIVKEKSVLRSLIHTTHSIQQQALEAEDDADAVLDRAESSIFELAEDRVREGLVSMKDVVNGNMDRLHRIITEGRQVTGLATGYPELDNLTSGLQPSELIILAARPSVGKTALALNLAENVAVRSSEPAKVAVFSLEMSKESLLMRLLSSLGGVDAHKFRTGHLSRDDWRVMTDALARLSQSPLWIDDSGGTTVMEIGAKARRLKRDKGLDLVIVDYLQLISVRGRFSNRNEEVTSITRSLKALAKELKVPFLVLSQLTRAPEREDRRPQLADLRESGAIEQDADVVMFIHRPSAFKPDEAPEERAKTELIIAKQRNGPTDKIHFVFRGNHTRFEIAAPDEMDRL